MQAGRVRERMVTQQPSNSNIVIVCDNNCRASFYTIMLNIGAIIIKASQLGPFTIIVASTDMQYAIIIAKVLQSVEEEDELVKDEDATEHEIVQDKKRSRQIVLAGQAKYYPALEGIEKCNKCSYKLSL